MESFLGTDTTHMETKPVIALRISAAHVKRAVQRDPLHLDRRAVSFIDWLTGERCTRLSPRQAHQHANAKLRRARHQGGHRAVRELRRALHLHIGGAKPHPRMHHVNLRRNGYRDIGLPF